MFSLRRKCFYLIDASNKFMAPEYLQLPLNRRLSSKAIESKVSKSKTKSASPTNSSKKGKGKPQGYDEKKAETEALAKFYSLMEQARR